MVAGHPASKRKRRLILAVKVLVIGGLFAYVLSEIGRSWGDVRGRIVHADAFFLAASVFFQVFSMVFLVLLWRELMAVLGEKLGLLAAARMQWLASLGKYIPGEVSTALGKVYLATVEGVNPKLVALGCVYEILFCWVGAALALLLAVLFGSLKHFEAALVPAVGLALVVLLCVHPAVLLCVVNWMLRRFAKDPLKKAIPYPAALLFALGYMIPYVLSGVCEFALVKAFYPEVPTQYMFDLIGLTTASTALGFAVLFAPGGLGVRDILLTEGIDLLVRQPGSGGLIALAARLLGLVLDAAVGLVSLVLYRGLPRRRDGQCNLKQPAADAIISALKSTTNQ